MVLNLNQKLETIPAYDMKRMETHTIRVALFEDSPADARLIKEFLTGTDGPFFRMEHFVRLREGLDWISRGSADVVLLDLSLPDSEGLNTFTTLRSANSGIPVVVLTGLTDDSVAIRAVQQGAQDYLIKAELNSSLLTKSIRYAIERKRSEEALRRAYDELELRIQERTAELRDANEKLQREITERKKAEQERLQMEQQLLHSQKMEALGTLAGGIAHDFNNIIATIMGQTDLIRYSVGDDDPIRENLDILRQASSRARDLSSRVLAFSRRKEGKREPVIMSGIIEDALRLIRASLPSNIKINRRISRKTGSAAVWADPSQMHQVIMNLCANAAHAMRPEGGTLEIALSCKKADEHSMAQPEKIESPGSYLQISVADTGCGIDPSILDKIFDPFFTTKGPSEGTGMGLAVVYGIVKSHRGTITVRSRPGKGARFRILLPRVEPLLTDAGESCGIISKGRGRIMLVDDERPLLETAKGLLSKLGYEVISDTHSKAALESFKRTPHGYDLVITDLTMPDITGTELAGEIMRIRPDIPVILYTGYGESINEEDARKMGIAGFISKPFSLCEIAEAIRNVLKGDCSNRE